MQTSNVKDVDAVKIKQIEYKGEKKDVKGVAIRWLSKSGKDASGMPEYGLRHFTVAPEGEIPVHNHFYLQTVYIESGSFECLSYDPETNKAVESKVCGPGDWVYCESMEPHGMRNISKTEPATFLCCICNLYK